MSAATLLAGPQAWLIANGAKLALYAALVSAIWLHGCHYGESGMQKENGALEEKVRTCAASVNNLASAIERQNKASAATKAEGDRRVSESQAAAARAQGALDALNKAKAKADAYERPQGLDECAAARRIVGADNAK